MDWTYLLSLPFPFAAGAAGGATSFLYQLKKGQVRNNHAWRKLGIEVWGGGLLGAFLGPVAAVIFASAISPSGAFVFGIGWGHVIGKAREAVSDAVVRQLDHEDHKDEP